VSNKAGAPRIIIVKKRVGGHDEPHGGAWKVAYADFVTAMMALFIVLWLLSASEKVQKAVGGPPESAKRSPLIARSCRT
jgi:chemotaxis protein MotB